MANHIFSILAISGVLFVLGAAVGSFLNVLIYRTISEESWLWGRSKTDCCSQKIHWYDNIPLVSYLVLKAKCRYCQEPIALTHPVIEFITGTLFVWWYWGGFFFFNLTTSPFQTLQPLFWLCVGVLLVMILVADFLYLLIPDVAVGLLFGLTVIYRFSLTAFGVMQPVDLATSVIGSLAIGGFFAFLWAVTKGKGMGFGDVKLAVPLTLLLGWPKILVGMFLAFLIGAIAGIMMIATKKRKLGQTIPFGPFLVIGTIIALLIGDEIIHLYMSLI